MHVTLVEINIKQDKLDKFLEIFRLNHLGSIEEEGNLRFDVLRDENIPTRFYIYEAYVDEKAANEHKKTSHYLKCVEELDSLMSEPRKKTTFIGVMPE
ncbi:(4S)-4-hydroxy-5-phosphonooxypentane-2,3-dione isomerase [Photorhabdus heterorhabditis]|uniref:(4S)-4-hydroxy-5-phosphonooxypentane-2,3-dione isomerase n=1 Tax=Photorhabdus heterorhabditis TaxID=880156 RepID=A0A5B0VP33_9GAMM|nr:(4S)-4-hydroxy-5-phosphonooxypentane-2,3-dione isomerase [Photorhabdus heterorhabditis]KAA1176450.1 (4S)-4-hydroxy-5-phosphonooxypentane-2,3-dione isomerase [Photorhabdus heterorhabditis]KOY61105.1 autoinducer-2 (AI-2) modifying protein LsrG [Photorhabdus heterorhabditis]MBS9441978.1 (4S)-4-hydroxy-5-phosphonooxypentane-2,3-dione isomerase [Photorhabdus heterorhabditis]NRN30567.1 (4S)-4-hydroxy-5-phosphonooxypentane-2,3-dione isomerase [Photorhabdus heterorhabditis subsp. aluminescens]